MPMADQSPDIWHAAALAALSDEALLEQLQRQTFRFFWDGAHPASGLTPGSPPGARGRGR